MKLWFSYGNQINIQINFSPLADYAFGKCLPKVGADREEFFREPLTQPETTFLKRMLQELQGAGLDWVHPFTQCRLQQALYAIRNRVTFQQDLCAHLTPPPEIIDPQSPLASVRFSPPNEDYAEEVFYPPLKKSERK